MTEKGENIIGSFATAHTDGDTVGCPPVCVVIPCYNAEKWIARSIQSGLNQNDVDVEVIVVDDGSADKSLNVIKSFGDQIRWQSGENRGACSARNCGLELARGEFILFLDSDDYIAENTLATWMRQSFEADLLLCPFAYEIGGRRSLGKIPDQPVSAQSVLGEWLEGRFVPSCSVLWRRTFLCSIGGWNVNALRNQDGELAIRGLLNGARVRVAHGGLGVYVQHEGVGRVSKRAGREVLASEMVCFQELAAIAEAQRISGLRPAFARFFYRLAYEAFANGIDDLGEVALARARSLGLKGHTGSVVHRLLSHVLGLKHKLRFTGILKGRRIIE